MLFPKLARSRRGKGPSSQRSEQGEPVSSARFSSEEIAAVEQRCRRTPAWRQWRLRQGPDQQDVIEISVASRPPTILKLTKPEPGRVAAAGFGGWGLTVGEDIGALLDALGGGGGAAAGAPGGRRLAVAPQHPVAVPA